MAAAWRDGFAHAQRAKAGLGEMRAMVGVLCM